MVKSEFRAYLDGVIEELTELRNSLDETSENDGDVMTSSEHFAESELRCKCCGVNKMKRRMLKHAEDVRAHFGGKPMIVSSAFRCPKHNREVGGVSKSLHLDGCAMDVYIPGVPSSEIVAYSKACGSPDAYSINSNYAHISVERI